MTLARAIKLLLLAGAALLALAGGVALAQGSGEPTISATEGQQFSGHITTVSTCPIPIDGVNRPVTIDWGDGSPPDTAFPDSSGVPASHTYAEEGTYHGTVTYSCGERVPFTANVADAAVHLSGTQVQGSAGQPFTGQVATLSDEDPGGTPSDYRIEIDWGDGSHSGGTVAAGSGSFPVQGSHTWAQPGAYQLTVTATDAGGASTSVSATATVGPAPPGTVRAAFTASGGEVGRGQPISFDASSSRTGGGRVTSYAWLVDGRRDGQCDGATSIAVTRFSAPGSHSITLQATDSSGAVTSSSQNVTVTGSPPHFPYAARRTVTAAQVFECLAGPGDPSSQLAPPVGSAPSCNTQVTTSNISAVGCLTQHVGTINLVYTKVRHTNYYDVFYEPGLRLEGLPAAENKTLLQDLSHSFQKDFARDVCKNGPQSLRNMYCQPVPDGGSLAPPSNGGDSAGSTPPPKAHGARAATSNAQPNVQLMTPCTTTPVLHSDTTTAFSESGTGKACIQLDVASGPVRINGVDYVPSPGAVIVIAPEFGLVVSESASTWLDKIKLHDAQQINYLLPDAAQGPATDYPALDVANLAALVKTQPEAAKPAEQGGLGSVGAFPSTGELHVSFADYSSTITFEVVLPPPFSNGNGGPVTATAVATISGRHGFQMVYARLGGPSGGVSVNMGPVGLRNFAVCWRAHASPDQSVDPCPASTGIPEDGFGDNFWDATGELGLGNIKLIFRPNGPPPPETAGCPFRPGIGFQGTSLLFVGAVLDTPGIPIAPGVSLQQLGASFTNQPNVSTLCAYANFDLAGGLAKLTGRLFAAFTKHGVPYHFGGDELGTGVLQRSGSPPSFPVTNDFAIGASGLLNINFPVIGSTQVGNGYILYVNDPSAAFFGSAFDFSLPFGGTYEDPPETGIGITGGISGGVGLGHGYPFFIEGKAQVVGRFHLCFKFCIKEVTVFRGGVDSILSHDQHGGGGLAVCGSISFLGLGVTGGIGYHWGDDIGDIVWHDVHSGGCDFLGEFRVNVQAAAATRGGHAAQVASTHVVVPRGASAVDLYLDGRDGAPDVTITGPGVHESTAALQAGVATQQGSLLLARVPDLHETYVTLEHPRPGTYTLTANPGSPVITAVRQAVGVTPSVTARVRGRGFSRRLAYRIKPEPGQTVDFVQRSGQYQQILGRAHGASGTLAFTAPPGGGRREILAEVSENGIPQQRLSVASYLPPLPQHLGRVARVKVKRVGPNALVRFAAVRGAREYAVYAVMGDGTRRSYATRRRAITLGPFFPAIAGRVWVTALGDGGYTVDGARSRPGVIPSAINFHRPGRRRRR